MRGAFVFSVSGITAVALVLLSASTEELKREEVMRHRNLGKAFYENPTTQLQAVDEFRKAFELMPDSVRERVNYGLALLRAGKTEEGVRELEKAQQQDPRVPHTWFNLGLVFKKASQYERAIPQLQGMLTLVPDEPVTHYNLGVLYKLTGRPGLALQHFEASVRLNSRLAGPHFQLYNAYRQLGRAEDAAREQKIFQEIKKATAGAAIPEDLEWSFYSEIYDPIEPAIDPREGTVPEAILKPVHLGAGVDASSAGLVIADVDGDGRPDLIVWSGKGIQVFRNGGPELLRCGLDGLTGILHIAPGDFNNDGFPDLAIVTKSGATLYENRNGVFAPSTFKLPAGRFSRAVWLDYDHDYDLDLVLVGQDAALARNNGTAGFSDETAQFPFVRGVALDAVMLDLVPDTAGFDLAVAYAGRSGVLYQDKLAGKYEATDIAAIPAGAAWIAAYDFNNDGWTDLAAGTPKGITLIQNHGGTFEPVATLAAGLPATFADLANRGYIDLAARGSLLRQRGVNKFEATGASFLANAVAVGAADFDGDGRVDLAVVNQDGSIDLLHNATETGKRSSVVSLTGVKNLKSAVHAKVEIKSGSRYGKQIYRGVPLLFGMGDATAIDTVRITWPNGMVQNELQQVSGKAINVKEAPRLSGSCPMIFTWNGRKFEFVTDVLGVAPLGASAGDGHYFPVDHHEYVQIPRRAMVPREGEFEVRITEELHEVSYLDQVRLLAVDHPGAEEIFTNDKFKSPPFPEFRLFGVKKCIYPISARDERDHDVLQKLLRRDSLYPDSFQRTYDGRAEWHNLDLDFGRAAASNRAALILHGWVDWADGSTFRAAAQERPGGLVTPFLQVRDELGQWRTVIEDMGMPSGKPKTIAVDLTAKFLSQSREVRIVTNLCVYWDEIFLSEDSDAEAVLTSMDALSADLHFRGFSKPRIDPLRKQPERFLYDLVAPVSQWNPTPGFYTRYGDVLPLISRIDDQLVIMGSGDELSLKFPEAALPPLASGWARDFLLLVDGWAKDADPNTASSRSVEPLPFHNMSAYPYPEAEHFPSDIAHCKYRSEYNIRPALRLLRPLTN